MCCKSKTDRERVTRWELLSTFAYLEANGVEKCWRTSLSRASPGLKDRVHSREKDQALRNMSRILSDITKLEDAQKELRRTWKTY